MGGKMKASVRLRGEGQKPLYSLKAPLNLLGLPLFAGCAIVDKTDVSLQVGTAFPTGPSVRLHYKPNEESVPHVLVVKAGLGPWLRPRGAHLALTAEVDLVNQGSTRILIRTTPRVGDYSLVRTAIESIDMKEKKAKNVGGEKMGKSVRDIIQASEQGNGYVADSANPSSVNGDAAQENVNAKLVVPNLGFGNKKAPTWGPRPKEGLWSLRVHSEVAVGPWGVAACRWGINLPRELFERGANAAKRFGTLPTIVLDKLSFETKASRLRQGLTGELPEPSQKDLARISDDVMALHMYNYNLKKAMEELRTEFQHSSKRLHGSRDSRPPSAADMAASSKVGKDAAKRAEPKVDLKSADASGTIAGASGAADDVSKQLRNAIMSAQGGK